MRFLSWFSSLLISPHPLHQLLNLKESRALGHISKHVKDSWNVLLYHSSPKHHLTLKNVFQESSFIFVILFDPHPLPSSLIFSHNTFQWFEALLGQNMVPVHFTLGSSAMVHTLMLGGERTKFETREPGSIQLLTLSLTSSMAQFMSSFSLGPSPPI